jgi:nucleoside 2-deoxyribosyltransferase
MKDQLVYLAGSITGLTYGESTDWRGYVRDNVAPGIRTLSPLRGKQYLEERSSKDGGKILDSYEDYALSCQKGINTRDHWDCSRCDAIFVNLLGAKTVSIGTVMEIAWGFAYRKPIILVMEEKGNLHDHSMIRESIGFRAKTLESGIELLNAILLPDKQEKYAY